MEVDRAVEQFGMERKWSATQIAKAKRIAYRVCWTESDWWLYASPKVPGSINILPNDGYPPSGGDHLSVGLYQQQMPWYPVATAMSVSLSTQAFLTEMLRSAPDWLTANESSTCQRTQKSQFDGATIDPGTGKPYPFAQNYIDRQAQTDALEADLQYFTHHG